MNPVDILIKKRDEHQLTDEEIKSFFLGYLDGTVKDYQISAMLMAIYKGGMSYKEISSLTKVMRDSGKVLKWEYPREIIVDKHSTGGVGDKTSIILLPLCVLEGLKVPMMSGRGLGHTGGTLDKLESIPGINVKPSIIEARKTLDRFGGVFMGQTPEIAALDQKMYAFRDVTGTVESIPLITASILSKKLAEGIGGLVMDVKFGSGAFMTEKDKAEELAIMIRNVATECGVNVRCVLSSMNSPLGRSAGNALEIVECLEALQGKGPVDLVDLTLVLVAEMVKLARPDEDIDTIKNRLREHLSSGRAYDCFMKIVECQGGDVSTFEKFDDIHVADMVIDVQTPYEGFVNRIDVKGIGAIVRDLGGGRYSAEDSIDYSVGLSNLSGVGDRLEKGDVIATIHAKASSDIDYFKEQVIKCYSLSESDPEHDLVYKII